MQRLSGQVFGPGFAASGSKTEFDLSDYGIRLITADEQDGAPPWTDIALTRGGWDGAQLSLAWSGRGNVSGNASAGGTGTGSVAAARYTIALTDQAAISAVTALAKGAQGATAITRTNTNGVTRAWSHAMIWLLFVLPIAALAAVLWQHEHIAAWAVSHIPAQQERKLGELVFAQQKAKLKLIEGKPLDLVREIGAKLTKGSAYQYEFYVADDKVVNAYAMPGGFVVLHSGLLQLAGSAEEVAGVLAHEVMHVEKRHSLKGMAKSLGVAATVSLVFGDLGGLASLGSDLIGLKFSRDHETEADSEGLKALVGAAVRPDGMAAFFRKMAAQDKLDLGFLSTHPASEERFAAIDAAIKALPDAARNAPALPHDYAAIKAVLPK